MATENGGRIELRLGTSDGEAAAYDAKLQVSSTTWQTEVRVGAQVGTKQVEFGDWRVAGPPAEAAAAPPTWLTDDARAALKAALRSQQGSGRWPRRLTRWRPEPSP